MIYQYSQADVRREQQSVSSTKDYETSFILPIPTKPFYPCNPNIFSGNSPSSFFWSASGSNVSFQMRASTGPIWVKMRIKFYRLTLTFLGLLD